MTHPAQPVAAALLAALLVLAAAAAGLAAGVASGQPAGEILAIDRDHPLATEAAVSDYEQTGHVTARLQRIDARLAVARQHEQVGLDGYYVDGTNTYLRFQYNETVPRRVRVMLPAGYFHPRPQDSLQAANADATARLQPTPGGNWTIVTIHVTGPTDAVFAVSKEAGGYFWARGLIDRVINETTGFSIPSFTLAGGQPWQYPPERALAGANTTYTITTHGEQMTLQYDTDANRSTTTWLAIPDCGDQPDAPVCALRRDGEPRRVHLVSTQIDPPPVRYKRGRDMWAGLDAAMRDLAAVPDRLSGFVDGLLGDGGGGSGGGKGDTDG